jgi:hypothetical protein
MAHFSRREKIQKLLIQALIFNSHAPVWGMTVVTN